MIVLSDIAELHLESSQKFKMELFVKVCWLVSHFFIKSPILHVWLDCGWTFELYSSDSHCTILSSYTRRTSIWNPSRISSRVTYIEWFESNYVTVWKCSCWKFFWSVLSHIWAECADLLCQSEWISILAGNSMLKSIRTRCEICSKLTIKIPERRQWRRSDVFIE